jgi:hypothetical protein
MIDVIEKAGGMQVESDTDGVFFSHTEPLLIFEKLQNALPTGIKIELEKSPVFKMDGVYIPFD